MSDAEDAHKQQKAGLKAIKVRLRALEKTDRRRDKALRREVAAARMSSEKAISVAEAGNQTHFANLNEWGRTFRDMKEGFVDKSTWYAERNALEGRLVVIESERATEKGAREQQRQGQARFSAALVIGTGVLSFLINLAFKLMGKP